MVAYGGWRWGDSKLRDGKLGAAGFNMLRARLVSIVDQKPPAVGGDLGPEDVVVRNASWRPIGPRAPNAETRTAGFGGKLACVGSST